MLQDMGRTVNAGQAYLFSTSARIFQNLGSLIGLAEPVMSIAHIGAEFV
eukprot:SAG31_NODE_770_length_12217_cov_2.855174_5_plen_49_part_00